MAAIPIQIGGPTNLADPSVNAAVVTPSDSTDLTYETNRVWVGTAGTMQVTMNGVTVEFQGIQNGTMLPISVTRIWSTNTSASNIIALWR